MNPQLILLDYWFDTSGRVLGHHYMFQLNAVIPEGAMIPVENYHRSMMFFLNSRLALAQMARGHEVTLSVWSGEAGWLTFYNFPQLRVETLILPVKEAMKEKPVSDHNTIQDVFMAPVIELALSYADNFFQASLPGGFL
jgi:hypothetical protein